MGYLWIFHTSRAARGQEWFGASAIASRAGISFPRCPGKAVALSQPSPAVCHVCHQPCASTATAAWPGNAGLLRAQIPPHSPSLVRLLSACHPSHHICHLFLWQGEFYLAALHCLGSLLGSPARFLGNSHPAGKWNPFNPTGAHLAPEMGPGWAMGMGKAFPEMGNDLLLLESHSRAWCPSLALPRPQRAGMGTVATLGLCLSPSHGNRVRNGQGRRSLLLCRLSYPDKHSQGSEGLCCRGGQCPGHPLGKQRGNEHLDSKLSLLLLGAHIDKPGCILWDKPCVLLEPGMLLLPSQGHPTAPRGALGTVLEPPRQRFERETKLLSNPSAEGAERWIKDLWVRAETIPA